jgi:ATP-dependent Lhr-like helicase
MSPNIDLHPVLTYHLVNTLGWSGLRPLQAQAHHPLVDGRDALLLAPTAGGKTEAAIFPLLSRMATEDWTGLSVLYICPLKALLNNLAPRLESYSGWLGRRTGLWHGDTTASARAHLITDPPDILLTTPESIETMLVSTKVNARQHFSRVRAVVVDELHAFAGDDRGWHLLAILDRLDRLAGRTIQRIGLSATIGNPHDLLRWLQGTTAEHRDGVVITPDQTPTAGQAARSADVELDYVGSLANAAKVIASLHAGQKRLVFADSRLAVERLAVQLRDHDVTTHVSHSSLSIDDRRQAEQAFTEARDCVIVATSTLELGIDVGDLDRVIQIGSPATVASFLQRLGRTGRRTGSSRNTLFLAPDDNSLLHAAGLLHLWSSGYVEPVTPPPLPLHVGAQQVLALTLQESWIGEKDWRGWFGDLPIFGPDDITDWLVTHGLLTRDSGMLSIGPEAERRYGRRHFMQLLSVITGTPEFAVLHGRTHIGSAALAALLTPTVGPRVLLLGGRAWRLTHIDWRRRHCYVEPTELPGNTTWWSAPRYLAYEMCQAQRTVLLGTDPAVALTHRARTRIAELRDERRRRVNIASTVVERTEAGLTWWTWAGGRANATLISVLGDTVDSDTVDDFRIKLRADVEPADFNQQRATALDADLPLPNVTERAVIGLKFADVLPKDVAHDTLAARLADPAGARKILTAPAVWQR